MFNYIIKEIEDKNVAIVGFGKEGKSTYNFIRRHLKNKKLAIIDSSVKLEEENSFLKGDANLDIILGDDYLSELKNYDLVIKSPGVKFKDYDVSEIRDKIVSQVEFVLKYYRERIIGVTASKGKSTTSSLIAKILDDQGIDVKLLGNIGNPIFDEIEEISDNTIIVIEMSAQQLEFVKYSPHISLILNLFEEHLDFFKNKEEYFKAKMNLFKYQKSNDYGIYTSINEELNKRVRDGEYITNLIDINSELTIRDGNVVFNNRNIYNTNDTRFLIGNHNLVDIMFALRLSELLKLDCAKTVSSINRFKPLEHRLELVGTFDGVTYYDDTIATIPTATINAIEGLKNVNTVIIGGMDRGINYTDLVEYLKNSSVENIICMPSTGYMVGKKLEENNNKNIIYIEDLREAVKTAKKITKKNTICLLSPAASSYEYFKNFEEKGNAYKKYIKEV